MAETVKAQLELLYRAGKVTFPQRAEAFATALEQIGEIHDQWYSPTIRAGSPTALVKAREINATVYNRLRRAVLSWQDMSFAVVAIADDFKDNDERASEAANAHAFTLDTQEMPPLPKPASLEELEA